MPIAVWRIPIDRVRLLPAASGVNRIVRAVMAGARRAL
jgi:hypothetical protein